MKAMTALYASPLLFMGFFFTLSSHLQLIDCLQLPPSHWPIPYAASLCLLFSGTALVFLHSKKQISKLLGIAIFTFGLKRFTEFLFHVPLSAHVGKMRILAAFGFMIAGILLVTWTNKHESIGRKMLLNICSVFLVSLGSIEMSLTLFQANSKFEPYCIHFYISFGFFCLGWAFLSARFNKMTTPTFSNNASN